MNFEIDCNNEMSDKPVKYVSIQVFLTSWERVGNSEEPEASLFQVIH